MIRPVFSIGLAVVMAACTEGGASAAGIDGVNWRLSSLSGAEVSLPKTPTLTVTGATASGFGGCNSYSAKVKVTGEAIHFSDLVSTRMACRGPVGSIESDFFRKLTGMVAGFKLDGSRLTLVDEAGSVVAELTSP